MNATLKAPFPYFGGKRRWASIVWERLGDPHAYYEPFAGSMAVLLARPNTRHPKPFEVVVDINLHVANYFRAVKADPEAVTAHCVHPTFHADLVARHGWLVQWGETHRRRFLEDPDYSDAKAAGWWAWGICLWIGGGWCAGRPTWTKSPHLDSGVETLEVRALGQQPRIDPSGGSSDGVDGVSTLEKRVIDLRERLVRISERLRDVVVLCGDWREAIPALPDGRTTGILLDPPYLTEHRHRRLYISDEDRRSDVIAREAWQWAIEHGETYRIVYCSHVGDFELPDGWTMETMSFSGIREEGRRASRSECVMFSPACEQRAPQADLFAIP